MALERTEALVLKRHTDGRTLAARDSPRLGEETFPVVGLRTEVNVWPQLLSNERTYCIELEALVH